MSDGYTVRDLDTPTGGDLVQQPSVSETRTSITALHHDYIGLADKTRVLAEDTSQGAAKTREWVLRVRAKEEAGRHLTSLLDDLYVLGFAWRDIARLAAVSVPAVRKWRKGGDATPENRARIARTLAVIKYLREEVPTVEDVAGWFETPIIDNPSITPLDILADGYEDVVLDYAQERVTRDEELLDRYDPNWRARRSRFEVVTAPDGDRTIQLAE